MFCSNCAGNYEDPDMTAEVAEQEPHPDPLQAILEAVAASDDGMLLQALRKAGVL